MYCYTFYSAEKNDFREDEWHTKAVSQLLLYTFPDVNPDVWKVFLHAEDVKEWRLSVHLEYP